MYYKNTSCSVKTFHGVTFNPGETKEVSDYINDKFMILIKEPIKSVTDTPQKKPSSDNKKESKKEDIQCAQSDTKSDSTEISFNNTDTTNETKKIKNQ